MPFLQPATLCALEKLLDDYMKERARETTFGKNDEKRQKVYSELKELLRTDIQPVTIPHLLIKLGQESHNAQNDTQTEYSDAAKVYSAMRWLFYTKITVSNNTEQKEILSEIEATQKAIYHKTKELEEKIYTLEQGKTENGFLKLYQGNARIVITQITDEQIKDYTRDIIYLCNKDYLESVDVKSLFPQGPDTFSSWLSSIPIPALVSKTFTLATRNYCGKYDYSKNPLFPVLLQEDHLYNYLKTKYPDLQKLANQQIVSEFERLAQLEKDKLISNASTLKNSSQSAPNTIAPPPSPALSHKSVSSEKAHSEPVIGPINHNGLTLQSIHSAPSTPHLLKNEIDTTSIAPTTSTTFTFERLGVLSTSNKNEEKLETTMKSNEQPVNNSLISLTRNQKKKMKQRVKKIGTKKFTKTVHSPTHLPSEPSLHPSVKM